MRTAAWSRAVQSLRLLSVLACAACRGTRSDQTAATASPPAPPPAPPAASPPADTASVQRQADSSAGALERYFDLATQIGASEQGMRGRLGAPRERHARPVENAHTGTTDSVVQLGYDGLEVELYKVVAQDKELVIEIVLTKPTRLPNLPITVGSPLAQVTAAFGDPMSTRDTAGAHVLDYTVGEVPNVLSFWIAAGVVRRIEWGFNID
jgi:hypothetical protein